ncbi:MAG: reverse transcriptase domain-containing protein [Candidatus Paceibacterota bacterium]
MNDVISNFDFYWHDNKKESNPQKKKYVRSAKYSPLGKLLTKINSRILAPYDKLLPGFIFGGVQGLNHKAAVAYLLGQKRKRVLLKVDISRFFEQIKDERVFDFFKHKCECGVRGAKLLASLCTVPIGPKNFPTSHIRTIARGFATSPRLAIWCNLDTFIKLDRLIRTELRGKDPRIAIYVDDIGVTASRVSVEQMALLYKKIEKLLQEDRNQGLPLNAEKTRIIEHTGKTFDGNGVLITSEWGYEHLGAQMKRNSLTIGKKTKAKLIDVTQKWERGEGGMLVKLRRKALLRHKRYMESA